MGRGWNAQRIKWSSSLVVGIGLVAFALEACGDDGETGPIGSGGSSNGGGAGEATSGSGASPSGGSSTGATGGSAGDGGAPDGGEPQGGSSTGGAPIGGEGGAGEGGEAGSLSGTGGMMGAGAGGMAGAMAGGGNGGMAGGGMAGGGSGGMAGGGMANAGRAGGGMAGGGMGGMSGGGNGGGGSGGISSGGMSGGGNGGISGAGGNGGFTSGGVGGSSGGGGMDGGRAGMSGDAGMGGTSGSSCFPVINEVSTAGTNAADEFVEIFNPCSQAFDLVGDRLVYRAAGGTSDVVLWNFQASTVIPAGGYLLFAGEGYAGTSDGVFSAPTGRLAATGGGVALRLADTSIVDSVGYGMMTTNAFVEASPANAPPSNQSIARRPNGVDTNNNSQDFAVATLRTPRAANP